MTKLEYAMSLVGTEPDEAMRLVCDYLNQYPKDPNALATAAYIEMKSERFGLAWALIDRALHYWPNNAPLLNNAGMCALGCLKLEEAEAILQKAIKLDPRNVPAINNLALVKVNQCKPDEAIRLIDKADSVEGKTDESRRETRGYAGLMLKRYKEGWQDFEGALHGKIRVMRGCAPVWDGKPVKTLVVRGEQGIGDELSFASVIPSITGVERLVIDCNDKIEELLQRSFPNAFVYGTRFKRNAFWLEHEKPDAEILSGSLCKFYRNESAEFPGTPYLKADPERVLQWKALLASLGDKPKIGIAWTGGLVKTHSERRSMDLEAFLPILRQDATFVSLQYRDSSAELEQIRQKHGIQIHDWPRATQTNNYDDTAALVASLDLVISVQTAVVHLAGGLGVPTWAMIPGKPLWRYGLQGNTLDWCKSVKLYRQKKDWAGVVNQVAEDLHGHW